MSDTATQKQETSQGTEATTAKDYFGYDTKVLEENIEKSGASKDIDPQELVNKTLAEIKVDENGKFIYPDGIDPMLKIAVANAKSFRDTQSEYTKTRQELKQIEAEKEALKQELEKLYHPTVELSEKEREELDELKIIDPDAWYKRMRALEDVSKQKVQEHLNKLSDEAKQQVTAKTLEEQLIDFNNSSEFKITPQMLETEIPPKWHQQVKDGEITFTELLEKAAKFLGAPKKPVTTEPPAQTTDLSKVNGSNTPTQGAEQKSVLDMYKTGQVII